MLLLVVFACSSMQTYSNVEDAKTILKDRTYQIRVRTGHETMDKLVYEFAYLEFSKYLSIVENGQHTSTIDIIFSSYSEGAYVGSTSGYATATGYASGWYTGSGYSATGSASTVGSGVSSGGTITWQNSTMFVILKDMNGKRLWSADYKYKGGWEMSGWTVNTPQEAARLCIERVAERLNQDLTSKK